MTRRLLRSPALQMVLLGGALFGGSLVYSAFGPEERPRIEVAKHRLDLTLKGFAAENRRQPTAVERQALLDLLIDQEILYQYALRLGMLEEPVVQRRLAKIAEFVDANPHHPEPSTEERAHEAVDLGLHEGDLVVRRILVDGARRLIRAVALLQEPSPTDVAAFLEANPQMFMRPARTRITHVTVNGFKWADTAEQRAEALLVRIRNESLSPDEATQLGDEPFVPATLPALSEQALATRFGTAFAEAIPRLPEGQWSGPVPSRYGSHLVYVHEQSPAYVPPLDEIDADVKQRLLQKRADERLALRLRELRSAFDIQVPEGAR